MSQLSNEDNLRLNVLLTQPLQAVRIDEGKMIVHGLTERGEAKVPLNPNCKDEMYVRRVKELISTHVIGSPGGYPVYLKRWTRMGQARSEKSLENLLKLGEPEAVVAVVHAPGLSNELARRAWWAMSSSENARRMLRNQDVVQGNMGKILAEFLLEFLPFEAEPRDIIESVRLVLQPGLISEEEREGLWSKGQRKNAYRVGFLHAEPDTLPEHISAHPLLDQYRAQLKELAGTGNVAAGLLLRVMDSPGQVFLRTVDTVMQKPANQDVVVSLMVALGNYFQTLQPHQERRREIDEILIESEAMIEGSLECCHTPAMKELLARMPGLRAHLKAMLSLSLVGEYILNPVLSTTDAMGTVMRRKLEPIIGPIETHYNILRGTQS